MGKVKKAGRLVILGLMVLAAGVVAQDPVSAMKRGNAAFDNENYDLAIKEYTEVIRLYPDAVGAYTKRGLSYICTNNDDNAIADGSQVIRMAPDNSNGYSVRGCAYYKKGDYNKAIKDFEKCLQLDPDNSDAKKWIALAREKAGTGGGSSSAPKPSGSGSSAPSGGTFVDSRDGKTYKKVKIGNQVWMAENLNYASSGSKCYGNNSANCNKYGRLYDWNTAKGACPAGWHLPSDNEWGTLVDYVGGKDFAGRKLKSTSGWDDNGNGTDNLGFSALPGGYGGPGGGFLGVGYDVWLWSATEYDASKAWSRQMNYGMESVYRGNNNVKTYLYPVRCVQDR